MGTDDSLPGGSSRSRNRLWRTRLWVHRGKIVWAAVGVSLTLVVWAINWSGGHSTATPAASARRPFPGRGRSGEHVIQPRVKDPVARSGSAGGREWEKRDIGERPDKAVCGVGGAVERYRGTSEDYWVCVHARPDVISDRVRHKGVWDDCEDQVWLLYTLNPRT